MVAVHSVLVFLFTLTQATNGETANRVKSVQSVPSSLDWWRERFNQENGHGGGNHWRKWHTHPRWHRTLISIMAAFPFSRQIPRNGFGHSDDDYPRRKDASLIRPASWTPGDAFPGEGSRTIIENHQTAENVGTEGGGMPGLLSRSATKMLQKPDLFGMPLWDTIFNVIKQLDVGSDKAIFDGLHWHGRTHRGRHYFHHKKADKTDASKSVELSNVMVKEIVPTTPTSKANATLGKDGRLINESISALDNRVNVSENRQTDRIQNGLDPDLTSNKAFHQANVDGKANNHSDQGNKSSTLSKLSDVTDSGHPDATLPQRDPHQTTSKNDQRHADIQKSNETSKLEATLEDKAHQPVSVQSKGDANRHTILYSGPQWKQTIRGFRTNVKGGPIKENTFDQRESKVMQITRSYESPRNPPLGTWPLSFRYGDLRKGLRYRRSVSKRGHDTKGEAKGDVLKTKKRPRKTHNVSESGGKRKSGSAKDHNKGKQLSGLYLVFSDGKTKKSDLPKTLEGKWLLDEIRKDVNKTVNRHHKTKALKEGPVKIHANTNDEKAKGKPDMTPPETGKAREKKTGDEDKVRDASTFKQPDKEGSRRHHVSKNVLGGVIALTVFVSFAILLGCTVARIRYVEAFKASTRARQTKHTQLKDDVPPTLSQT